jgi:MYXO-CTERM domain-containing protein
MRAGLGLLLVLAGLGLGPRAARANGAFPDALSILLPADQPETLILATNFGLVFSHDGGRTWEWTCEHGSSLGAILYQQAPSPRRTIITLGLDLVRSDDEGCTWTPATGRAAAGFLYDFFIDPSDGNRVLVAANPNDETPARVHVFESTDGGATFPTSLFTAEPGLDLGGLETAASDPDTLYLTWASSKSGELRSGIIRVQQHGASVQTYDHFATLGGNPLGIAAVDRKDPRKLFLRAYGNERDRLAISEDGGATVRVALEANRSLTGLVLRPDGVIFAAARDLDGGSLFVSRDGGKTFAALPRGPRFRALAERGGRLYAAADDTIDGYALGVSDDDGQTWKPLMRYHDVARVKSCPGTELPQVCTPSCVSKAMINVFRSEVCAPSVPPDAAAPPDAGASPPPPGGCGCRLGSGGTGGLGLAIAAALAAGLRRRRAPGPRSAGR